MEKRPTLVCIPYPAIKEVDHRQASPGQSESCDSGCSPLLSSDVNPIAKGRRCFSSLLGPSWARTAYGPLDHACSGGVSCIDCVCSPACLETINHGHGTIKRNPFPEAGSPDSQALAGRAACTSETLWGGVYSLPLTVSVASCFSQLGAGSPDSICTWPFSLVGYDYSVSVQHWDRPPS